MKQVIRKITNGILSVTTTLMIMAAPVAAMAYAAQPTAAINHKATIAVQQSMDLYSNASYAERQVNSILPSIPERQSVSKPAESKPTARKIVD